MTAALTAQGIVLFAALLGIRFGNNTVVRIATTVAAASTAFSLAIVIGGDTWGAVLL